MYKALICRCVYTYLPAGSSEAIELVHQIQLNNNKESNAASGSSPGTASSEGIHLSSYRPRFLLAEDPSFPGIWLGSDESGKGDYFGPLVVAAVCLDKKGGEVLLTAGVKDCKALTDEKVLALAEVIRATALGQPSGNLQRKYRAELCSGGICQIAGAFCLLTKTS